MAAALIVAQVLTQGKTIHAGHHDIADDEVGDELCSFGQSFLAIHGKFQTVFRQTGIDVGRYIGVVFYQ